MMNGYACRLEIAAQDLPYVIGRMRADVDAAAYSTALSRAEGRWRCSTKRASWPRVLTATCSRR